MNLQLEEYLAYKPDEYQYFLQSLYSLYSVPNIILPFFGGYLVHIFGLSGLLKLLALLVTVGQIVFSIGLQMKSSMIMYAGRFLFGIGGETLGVLQSQITSTWFREKELALALGLNICIGRLGSVLNDVLTPFAGKIGNVVFASWLGVLFCFLSCASAYYLAYLVELKSKHSSLNLEDANNFPLKFNFSRGFWLVCLLIIFSQSLMIPFNSIHAALLELKFFKGDTVMSAQVMAVPDLISSFLVAPAGYLIDRYGHRTHIWIFCCFLVLITHTTFFLTPSNSTYSPVPALFILGIAYSLIATIWSAIPLLTHPSQFVSAFGIATSASNAALVIFPYVVSMFITFDRSYSAVELFFILLAFLGGLVSLTLLRWDKKNGNALLLSQDIYMRNEIKESYNSLDEELDDYIDDLLMTERIQD